MRYFGVCQFFLCLTLPLLLSACARTYLTTVEYNQEKGLYEEISYSRHFEGEAYIIPNEVRIFAYADIQQRVMSEVTDQLNQWETAEIQIYFSNKGPRHINLRVNDILFMNHYYSDRYLTEPRDLAILPNTVEKIIVQGRKLDRNDKRFKLLVNYTLGNKKYAKEIEMRRFTVEEYKAVKPFPFSF